MQEVFYKHCQVSLLYAMHLKDWGTKVGEATDDEWKNRLSLLWQRPKVKKVSR